MQVSIGRSIRHQRNIPARLQDTVLLKPLVQERAGAIRETFKTEIFYPVLDKLILQLNVRFCGSTVKGIQALNPARTCFFQLEKIKPLEEMSNENLEDLAHELPQAKRLLEHRGKTRGKSLLDFLVVIEPYKAAFYVLHRLTKMAVATLQLQRVASHLSN